MRNLFTRKRQTRFYVTRHDPVVPNDRCRQPLLGPGQSSNCVVPHRMSGIRRNRLGRPPQIVSVIRIALHKEGLDYERAIGWGVLALNAVITY
jgi:hypothetical protein